MPRPDEGIGYENTYPYLLTQENLEVISRCKRGNDTRTQSNYQYLMDEIIFLEPEFVVVHLGIVDCAPRVFSRFEHSTLRHLPKEISRLLIGLASKYRKVITKIRLRTYVSLSSFRKNLVTIIESSTAVGSSIILVKIIDTN